MRILGIFLMVLGVLTLADQLLAPVLQTLVDPGPIRSGIDATKTIGPALTLALGLCLMKRGRKEG